MAVMAPRRGPSHQWDNIKAEDLGNAFSAASPKARRALIQKRLANKVAAFSMMSDEEKEQRRLQTRLQKMKKEPRPQFLTGKNRFIFTILKVSASQKKQQQDFKKLERVKSAQKNAITRRSREKFTGELESSVEDLSKFLWDEILPLSLGVPTSLARVNDWIVQVLDGVKVELPVDFLRKKTMDAVYLRIVRYLSDRYQLTPDEVKLMTMEFKMRSPLTG